MENKVYILVGLPGSGKSHYTSTTWPHAMVVSADDYFLKDGQYCFDPLRLGEAHQECFRKFMDAVQFVGEETIVVDNTNLHIGEIAPYVLAAQAFGYDTTVVLMRCDAKTAYERNTHGVSIEGFLHMIVKLEKLELLPWWNVNQVYVTYPWSNKMSWKLYIDDLAYDKDSPERHAPEGYVVATTSDEAIELVKAFGLPELIDFDHDLGRDDKATKFANWMAWNYPDGPVPEYHIHSANPIGSENIKAIMDSWNKSID